MRVSTNLSKTDRKTLYIDNLEGVDLRRGDDLKRADNVKNLINKNGKIVKRNGWKEIHKFDNKIDWLCGVSIKGVDYLLVYTNKNFYLFNDKTLLNITLQTAEEFRVDAEKLQSGKLEVIKKEDVYYILGAGEFLMLGDFGEGVELRSVRKCAYIPTTTIGITPNDQCVFLLDKSVDDMSRGIWYVKTSLGYEQVALTDENPRDPATSYYNRIASYQLPPTRLESENLLSPYRKNTLLGVSGQSRYKLDCDNIAFDERNVVKIKALENNDLNVYELHERTNYKENRYFEVGDNLKGLTINVTANSEAVYCSGLQNGLTNKGKVVFSGSNIECFWYSNGITELGWNSAKLKLKYLNTAGETIETVIAEASRSNVYSAYSVTYLAQDIELNKDNDVIIDSISVHGSIDKYVKATLKAFVTPLVDKNQQDWGSLDHKRGIIFLRKSAISADGSDNIEVTFRPLESNYREDVIDCCTIGAKFGVDGNTDRLFVSGNKDYPNVDFASESEDFTYFPIDYVYKFGLDSTPIVGYARLNDDTQAIFKSSAGDESNVYLRKGKWTTKTVSIYGNSLTFNKAEFLLKGNFLTIGATNSHSISYLDGEPIYLTEKGVYSLKTVSDLTESYKISVNRGAVVDNEIIDNMEHFNNAVTYDNNYCLSIGDKLYIAKSNSYFYENGVKQYNWWIWDNIPSSCLAEYRGELYFGTAEGRICKFTNEFSDIYYNHIAKGEMTIDADKKVIAYNEGIKINLGDKILFNESLFMELYSEVEVIEGKILVTDTKNLSNEFVYIDNNIDTGLETGVEYQIRNIDYYNNTFELYKDGRKVVPTKGGFRISLCVAQKELEVDKLRFSIDASKNDLLSLKYRLKKVKFIDYMGVAQESSPTGKVIVKKPVVALWKTAKANLSYPTMLKTVHKVGLNLGDRTTGKIRLLCESKSQVLRGFDIEKGINFINPNMAGFSFDGSVTKECFARVKFREVGYLSIVIVSEDESNFELSGFSIEFSLLKSKRGIY